MAQELIAELHDVGKLVDAMAIESAVEAESGKRFRLHDSDLGSHCFRRNLEQFGFTPPSSSLLWLSILYHLRGSVWGWPMDQWAQLPPLLQDCAPDDLRKLLLVMLADQTACSVSRALERTGGADHGETTQRVSVLWQERRAATGKVLPIDTRESLQKLFDFLGDRPTWDSFREAYGEYLAAIPEDKDISRAVTTLRTHLELTGKCFRVFDRSITSRLMARQKAPFAGLLYGSHSLSTTLRDVQSTWRFRVADCTIHIPAIPAALGRFHDLGVFARLEATLDALKNDGELGDHVLLTTFQRLWLFLPLEEIRPLRDVLRPLLDAGFQVEANVREGPLTSLTAWGSPNDGADEYVTYLQPELPETINPPLCEVCQLAAGHFYQKNADDPAEYLCALCAETRDRYSQRFTHLASWSEGYAAWLRVFLDFDALDRHLRGLFQGYVAERGKGDLDPQAQDALVRHLRTTALTVDYVNDFLAMQNDLADRLRAVFQEENVEALTAERKEVMVVRLARRSDVFRLLQVCDLVARRHFPRSVPHPPFRFAVSLGPVRFPFGEHWRSLQQVGDDITVTLVGGGRLVCRLEAIPNLMQLAQDRGGARRGLHRLADLAAESEALARVALADREERDLAGIARQLGDLGLDFASIATFARLSRE